VRHVLLGFLYASVAAIGFSLLASLLICCGLDPEARTVSDAASPLLGIFVGAYAVSRTTSWRTGVGIGLIYVAVWFGFWMYVMGRLNPILWIAEGLPHLTFSHFIWWCLTILTGAMGSLASRIQRLGILSVMVFASLWLAVLMMIGKKPGQQLAVAPINPVAGYQIERQGPTADGTIVYLLTFDFQQEKRLSVGLYDCDTDDATPDNDSDTTYLGQSLTGLVDKLSRRVQPNREQLLCVLNGGFFGASGMSVGHHEEPIVLDGHALYNVDLLRPTEQGWFFAVNPSSSVETGSPRFSMLPSVPWGLLQHYQTVLGGVRPLRVDGNSLELKPGAGSTTLRCSRTSVGWSADGNKFYVLSVYDPDGELASQVQRKMGWKQTGGWDVGEVQKFWEQKGVPDALLFDGGESTQLAFRGPEDMYHYFSSGYQYSFTVGYLFDRPLRFNLPILPPSEGRRGVLNYLYINGPDEH
jgi:hypothetical protein